jgi:hypothetical protein
MTVLISNNVTTTLASAITADASSLVVASNADRFPTITAGQYYYVTLISPAGAVEVVKVVSRTGAAMGIVRAQDGTNAVAFAAGSRVEMRINALSVLDAVDDGVADAVATMTVVTDALDTRLDTAEANIVTLDGRLDVAEPEIDALQAFDTTLGTSAGSNSVGFLQSGTSAVARTVQAKLRDLVSVFDFMTTAQIADVQARTALVDVTVPLQTAINAACAAQAQLFWPRGIYLISASLTVKSKTNWKGEGGSYSIIKNNGTVRFMLNDDDTNMVDVTIDGLGFDYNGYNALNFGTAMSFNGLSHTRFRIVNNRVFDSNYPGDNVILQRQGLFVGPNQDVWVLNNDFSHGARIKVGRGGHNVYIQSNKLFYINDNAITMAMDGRVATPNGDFTRNVHIEDNIIINPSGNGIFLGADGEAEDDPAMFVRNVVVSRNIVYLDTPNTSDLLTPRFMQFIAPRGGVSDVLITDNVFVMTTNTPSTTRECIRFNSPATPVGSFDRVSVTQNKFYTPYKTSTGVYVGVSHNTNDLVISNNEFDGVTEAIWMVNAPTHARPSITGNVIRNAVRGLRVDGDPVVTNGQFSSNRVVAPDAAIFFASTNAMEWTVKDNQIVNSATDAIELRSAGTKNFYITDNDLRGGTTGPIRLTSSAVLSTSSARYNNLGDAALPEVASAATVTVPHARVIVVTGTTNIDNITTTGRAGQMITLIFGGALTVNDGTGNLRLAGNFTTTTDDALTLVCTGNLWYEVARSVN